MSKYDGGSIQWLCEYQRELVNAFVDIEYRGFPFDPVEHMNFTNRTKEIYKKWEAETREVSEFKKYCKKKGIKEFNLNSSAQLQQFMFSSVSQGGLELEPFKLSKKTGQPSTDKASLSNYANDGVEFAEKLLVLRNLSKILSSFGEPMLRFYSPVTGAVHPSYFLAKVIDGTGKESGTHTGRLCVAGNTKILTNNGLVEIQDITSPNTQDVYLFSGKGIPRKVINYFFKGYEVMYDCTLSNGSTVRCTAGHRLLTAEGWKHLRDITCSDRILSYEEETLDHRMLLQFAKFPSGFNNERDCCEVQYNKEFIVQNTSTYKRSRTPKGIRKNTKIKRNAPQKTSFDKAQREYKRSQKWSQCATTSKRIRKFSKSWLWGLLYSRKNGYNSLVCTRKYENSQFVSLFKSPLQNVRYRPRFFKSTRKIFTRIASCCERYIYQSTIIFRKIIYSFLQGFRTSLVNPGLCNVTWPLPGITESRKDTYLLEYESSRNSIISSSFKRGIGSCSTIFSSQNTVHSRFLFPRFKDCFRNRRRVSSDKRGEKTRLKERTDIAGSWDIPIKISTQNGRTEYRYGCKNYQGFKIEKIEEAGVHGVYDIEVEEDHSYLAQGFVHHNSCANPNLQQLSKRDKDEKGIGVAGVDVRRSFIPRPGEILVEIDQSQVEVRVAGIYAGDTRMGEYFDLGGDFHSRVAAMINHIAYDDFELVRKDPAHPDNAKYKKMRTLAKNTTFGLMYGMGLKKLARDNNLSEEEAEKFIEIYFSLFPQFAAWRESMIQSAIDTGIVTTLFGRVRRLKIEGYSTEDGSETRIGINTPVQSCAADIVLCGLSKIWRRLKKERWRTSILGTIHDSIIYSVPEDELKEVLPWIVDWMKNPPGLGWLLDEAAVKLDVGIDIGLNFRDMCEVTLNDIVSGSYSFN